MKRRIAIILICILIVVLLFVIFFNVVSFKKELSYDELKSKEDYMNYIIQEYGDSSSVISLLSENSDGYRFIKKDKKTGKTIEIYTVDLDTKEISVSSSLGVSG